MPDRYHRPVILCTPWRARRVWTKRQALLGKALSALTLCFALVALIVPRLISLNERTWPDQRSRPLVILATQGGDVDYSVQVRSSVATDGDFRFVFYLESEALEGDGVARPFSRFQVIVIGEDLGGRVVCGDGSSSLDELEPSELDPGPSHAYQVDHASSRGSATNYRDDPFDEARTEANDLGGPSPTSSPATSASDEGGVDVLRYTGDIAGWFQDEDPHLGRSVGDDGWIWVEECTLDSTLVWSSSAGPDNPMTGAQATLFAPQFNLTSIEGVTDHQKDLYVRLWVDRVEGATVAEAFPGPTTHAAGWQLWYDVYLRGTLGAEQNFLYTDQPTWMIANRNASREEQLWLLFGGMGLGLALTLLVRGFSDLVDAAVREQK